MIIDYVQLFAGIVSGLSTAKVNAVVKLLIKFQGEMLKHFYRTLSRRVPVEINSFIPSKISGIESNSKFI